MGLEFAGVERFKVHAVTDERETLQRVIDEQARLIAAAAGVDPARVKIAIKRRSLI